MARVAFIGGGSAKFVREQAVDLISYEELRDAQVVLMDIDRDRVEKSESLVRKMFSDRSLPATVESTLDQRKALEGADYVIVTIMVGGHECYRNDVAIPAKYGVSQCIGDTTGPGGVMRFLRTAPVIRQIVEDLKTVAPDAWVLNYSNPMSMNTWAYLAFGHANTVGLCHSIQGCPVWRISKWLGIPADEIRYTAGGINHINFYLALQHNGQDLYPGILANAERIVEEHPKERAAMELVRYLGYLPAESPRHQTEYYPWFRKNEQMCREYDAELLFGYQHDVTNFTTRFREVDDQLAGRKPISYDRSLEYGIRIIHSMETGTVREVYGNVRNNGLIENLPDAAVVEVPCVVDEDGLHPKPVGRIPARLAAVMTPHIHLQEMAVQASVERDKRLARHAIQADPLTGAMLTLKQTGDMVEELLEANREYLEGW